MANDPANELTMIRQQITETRTALTNKVQKLKERVAETAHGVSTAITETADSVQEIVQDAVHTVKHSVQGTVTAVKDTFDLPRQVERRPWTMLAGATALGFLGGSFLYRKGSGAVARAVTAEPSLSAYRSGMFQAEISQLKGLAVGTLFAMVRDLLLTESVPKSMERQVADIINGFTVKLGGQTIPSRLLQQKSVRERLAKRGYPQNIVRREQSNPRDIFPRVLKGA
jgi:ElaB/YqjD/DUF883 family membrane-anchored ribosome-binding protein